MSDKLDLPDVVARYRKGEGFRKLAKAYGVSVTPIKRIVHAANLKPHTNAVRRKVNYPAVLRLDKQGKTVNQISKQLNLNYHTVRQIVRTYGTLSIY